MESTITYLSSTFFEDIASKKQKHVHLILIATKPDIIKQIPLYKELKQRGHLVLLGHTGQHYDENLSGGMLKEFGVEPDFNLNVRGAMHEVVSLIIGRLGHVIGQLKEIDKIVIPYVHGDTTTAMAASNAGYCQGFCSVHVEAGIRTLTPRKELLADIMRIQPTQEIIAGFREKLRDRNNWRLGSREPIPEQFNTRCAEAATGVHLAPVELDRDFMRGEGYCDDRIFVVGNSVADATHEALHNAKDSTIFQSYPLLQEENFVRFCIHRRENCFSEKRFSAIFEAMIELIEEGKHVVLISLFQTEAAIDRYGFREKIEELQTKFDTFIYSSVWPQYTDVIAAMNKAAVCATDSGSMQEEMNVMGVPCVTLRFGSDRSESIMNGGNLLAPPIDKDFIKQSVLFAWNNQSMRDAPKLYESVEQGSTVSKVCIDYVESVLANGEVTRSDEERLGLNSI